MTDGTYLLAVLRLQCLQALAVLCVAWLLAGQAVVVDISLVLAVVLVVQLIATTQLALDHILSQLVVAV
jgi:hypothetical protein